MLQEISMRVAPAVRARHAVPVHEAFVLVAAVPGRRTLPCVTVGHDQSDAEHQLAGGFDVPQRDQVLHVVPGAQRNHQRQHHREARVDGARNEVGREDRRVPAGQNADCEVEADDRCERKAPAASQDRPAADKPSDTDASGSPSRASQARERRRSSAATCAARCRAWWPDRESGRIPEHQRNVP